MVHNQSATVPCVAKCSSLNSTTENCCKYLKSSSSCETMNPSTIQSSQVRPPSGGPPASVDPVYLATQTSKVTGIQFEEKDIEYRGEGNSSIVVSLVKEGKVIRLLKKSSNVENGEMGDLLDSTRNRLQDIIRFESEILSKILNNNFLHKPRIIYLTQSQVETINSVIMPNRPDHRLSKLIPNQSTYALLLPDYCDLKYQLITRQCSADLCHSCPSSRSLVPTFAKAPTDASSAICNNYIADSKVSDNNSNENVILVDGIRYQLIGPVISTEIKPKQGFLPSIESLPAKLAVKARVSRFCLKQFHKMKRGRISFLSHYCPLDLYSGCRVRQYEAIESLLRTPQNNLRIFKNLKLVYGEEKRISFMDVFSDQLTCHSPSTLSWCNMNSMDKKVQLTGQCRTKSHATDQRYHFIPYETPLDENDAQSKCDDANETLVRNSYINLILKALNLSSDQSIDSTDTIPRQGQCDRRIKMDSPSICHLHSSLRCAETYFNSLDQLNLSLEPKTQIHCDCTEHYLNSHSVLGCVYSAQKLDSIDSSRALDLTRRLHDQLDANLMIHLRTQQPPSFLIGSPCRLRAHETFDQFCFRKVWEFVVSLTPKDCSIMITMQRVKQAPEQETLSPSETSSSGNCDEVDVEDEEEDEDAQASSSTESSQLEMCESNDSCDSICPCQVVNYTLHSDKQTLDVTADDSKATHLLANGKSNEASDATPLITNSLLDESQCKLQDSAANGLHIVRDEVTDQLFAVAIALTDLDPKLPATYLELERKINQKDEIMVQEFNELFSNQLSH